MKASIFLILVFASLCCPGQGMAQPDSLEEVQLNEMRSFFREVESADLPYSVKADMTYVKVKAFIQANPKNPNYILWCKYLDINRLDSLYSLIDSSVRSQMDAAIRHQKIRSGLMPGAVFPDLVLTDSSGNRFNISALRGKIVLVNVWSSFCKPCREEMPLLKRLYSQYKDSGLVIIGASVDHDRDKWLDAVNKDGQNWVQISELKPWPAGLLVTGWGITGIPYNFLIGKDGKLIDKEIGGEFIERRLQSLF